MTMPPSKTDWNPTSSQEDTATKRPQHFGWKRYKALAKAEVRQYLRNKTLLLMALIFPIGVALIIQLMGSGGGSSDSRFSAAISMEIFLLITLMFVQFYSVLSMATTRRDERVLKRLRTGEARDSEIIAALATPGAIMAVILTALMSAILIVMTGELPHTGILTVLSIVLGIIISTALALITSTITTNAEAAQMTSLPVMVLAMLSQSPLRSALPVQLGEFIGSTPFALLGDLTFIEWTGQPFTSDAAAADSSLSDAVSAASALGAAGFPLLLLLIWSGALAWAASRYMKWETNR